MLARGIKKVFIGLIVFYQAFISPMMKSSCRYYPSCSTYSLMLFRLTPPMFALFFSIIRILKCNPWFKGGYDYPRMKIVLSQLEYQPIKCLYWFVPIRPVKLPLFFLKPIRVWAYILVSQKD